MKRQIHINADLSLQMPGASIQIENTDQQNIAVRISDLLAVGNVPVSKIRAFRLLRKISRTLDQKISVYIEGKKWLSCHDGRLAIHNYLLTLRAILR